MANTNRLATKDSEHTIELQILRANLSEEVEAMTRKLGVVEPKLE